MLKNYSKKDVWSLSIKGVTFNLYSKKLKKLYVTSLLSLFGSQALAEQSAWFLGAEVGYGMENKINMFFPLRSVNKNAMADSIGFGLVAGYKQMFTNYFGLRYYLNVDYFPFFVYNNFSNFLAKNNHSLLNAAINVDALLNLYHTKGFSMGTFAGVQLGMNGWGGKMFALERDLYNEFKKDSSGNYKAQNANLTFSASLNLGMKFDFGHHGVEAYGVIPVSESILTDLKTISNSGDKTTQYKTTIRLPYVAGLRYVYNF